MPKRRPYKRTDRLSVQIQQVLAVAVQSETHEEVLHTVMITAVELTSDLSLARVFYYTYGGDLDAIDKAFTRANSYLRRRVGQEIRARVTPELRFHHDDGVDRGRRVDNILSTLDLHTEVETEGSGEEE
ncbi:MAG: ribosome-binding factor A [Myxococcota bacterium]|jgi:ribosome-binding factor A